MLIEVHCDGQEALHREARRRVKWLSAAVVGAAGGHWQHTMGEPGAGKVCVEYTEREQSGRRLQVCRRTAALGPPFGLRSGRVAESSPRVAGVRAPLDDACRAAALASRLL